MLINISRFELISCVWRPRLLDTPIKRFLTTLLEPPSCSTIFRLQFATIANTATFALAKQVNALLARLLAPGYAKPRGPLPTYRMMPGSGCVWC